jgi:O-acetyl-ADP-ribose deacetylase (regulator of RNase III)
LSCYVLICFADMNPKAFPAISSGIFGYPYGAAACVAGATVRAWLEVDANRAAVCPAISFGHL